MADDGTSDVDVSRTCSINREFLKRQIPALQVHFHTADHPSRGIKLFGRGIYTRAYKFNIKQISKVKN